MSDARYDQIDRFYAEFIEKGRQFSNSVTAVSAKTILKKLENLPQNITILDLACGEGHLTHRMAKLKQQVIGVDIAENLLEIARQHRPRSPNVSFLQDDAQNLTQIETESIDCVICNMALMDIPNIDDTFQAVYRVLKPNGTFIISILHPCFESPFFVPEPQIAIENDQFEACYVRRYTQEGYWNSGGTGIRGRVGAHHRMISTYFNGLMATGFQLKAVDEPHLPTQDQTTVEEQWFSQIPRLLMIESSKA